MDDIVERVFTEYGEYTIDYLKPRGEILSITLRFPRVSNGLGDNRALWGFICIDNDNRIILYSHLLKSDQFTDRTGHFCACKNIMQLYVECAHANILIAGEALEMLFKHARKLGYKIS